MVTVKAAGRQLAAVRLAGDSYLSSSDSRLHFGLGSAAKADSIAVKWPSGVEQTLSNVGVRSSTSDRRAITTLIAGRFRNEE